MGNMTLFIVGIAILSAGTYLMRSAAPDWAVAWRSLNALRHCYPMPPRYCCFPSPWPPPFMKASILLAWHAFSAWRSRSFSPGVRCH